MKVRLAALSLVLALPALVPAPAGAEEGVVFVKLPPRGDQAGVSSFIAVGMSDQGLVLGCAPGAKTEACEDLRGVTVPVKPDEIKIAAFSAKKPVFNGRTVEILNSLSTGGRGAAVPCRADRCGTWMVEIMSDASLAGTVPLKSIPGLDIDKSIPDYGLLVRPLFYSYSKRVSGGAALELFDFVGTRVIQNLKLQEGGPASPDKPVPANTPRPTGGRSPVEI